MKQLERVEVSSRATNFGNECNTSATDNTEPEYAVIEDTDIVCTHPPVGNYDLVKCPAYNSISHK